MSTEFELERFERVQAGGGVSLLRIAGVWRAPARERLSPPMLLIDDGRRSTRLAALPGPDDPAPLASAAGTAWRAAFSEPERGEHRGAVAFALDVGGAIFDLPAPEAHPLGHDEPDAEELAGEQPAALAGVSPAEWNLRAELAAEREWRSKARAEIAAARAAMVELERQLQDERAARRAGVEPGASDAQIESLAARLADAEARAAQATARALDAERWAQEAEDWLADAGAREAAVTTPPRPARADPLAGSGRLERVLLAGSAAAFLYLLYELVRTVVG